MKNLVIAAILATGAFAVGCGKSNNASANKLTTTPAGGGQSVLGSDVTGDQNAYDLLKTAGTGGTATFTGSVDGNAFTPMAAFYDTVGDANGTPLLTYVVLASNANYCTALIQDHNQLALSQHVVMAFESTDTSGTSLLSTDTSKAFTITTNQNAAGNLGAFAYLPYDEACAFTSSVNDLQATAGSITVSKLDLGTAVGTFQATVGDQAAAVSGSFTAVPCPGLGFLELSLPPYDYIPGCQ